MQTNIQKFYSLVRKNKELDTIENINTIAELEHKYIQKLSPGTLHYLKNYIQKESGNKWWFVSWNWVAFFSISGFAFYRRLYSLWIMNFILIFICMATWRGILSFLGPNYVGPIVLLFGAITTVILRSMFTSAYYVWRIERKMNKGVKRFSPSGWLVIIPFLIHSGYRNANPSIALQIQEAATLVFLSKRAGELYKDPFTHWWFGL